MLVFWFIVVVVNGEMKGWRHDALSKLEAREILAKVGKVRDGLNMEQNNL